MPIPDINYLNQIGEFCVKYGGWAAAIFEGVFIGYLMRSHRKDRKSMEEARLSERTTVMERFENYHNELIELVKNSTRAKDNIASKLLSQHSEVRSLNLALQRLFDLTTAGILKIKPPRQEDINSITVFLDNGGQNK